MAKVDTGARWRRDDEAAPPARAPSPLALPEGDCSAISELSALALTTRFVTAFEFMRLA